MCVCVLIHGTWGSRSDFSFTDSLFCRAIQGAASADIEFERFEWGGGNSSLERTEAATRLRRFISDIPEAKRPLYIIAHSHGGNIAIEAVRGNEAENHVDGIITMGTPFLSVEPRWWISILASFAGLAGLWSMTMGLMIASIGAVIGAVVGMFQPYYGMLGVVTIVTVFAVAAKSPVTNLMDGAVAFAERTMADCSAATTVPLRSNLLVIHSRGDEALWWLQHVFSVTGLPFTLFGAGLWLLGWSTVVAFLLALPALLLHRYVSEGIHEALIAPLLFCLATGVSLAVAGVVSIALVKLANLFIGTGPTGSFWSNVATRPNATQLPVFECDNLEAVSAPIASLHGGLWHSKFMRCGDVVDQVTSRLDRWNMHALRRLTC